MNQSTKEALLEQFREYLEITQLGTDHEDSSERDSDLFSLFTELAALHNEVRIESRQFKATFEQFKSLFDLVQVNQDNLTKEVEKCRTEQKVQQRETTRSLLYDFLEIYDRLEASLVLLDKYTPSFLGRFCKTNERLIDGLREGQAITKRRLEQVLIRYQVRPLEVVGKPLDPHTMRAIEVAIDPDVEHGIVVEELRKGFMWADELLRVAEVKVNRKDPSLHHDSK